MAEGLIVPAWEEASQKAATLDQSLIELCQEPTSARLETVRTKWREARLALRRTETFWFGPFAMRRSYSVVDWSPVSPRRIEAMLADRESMTPDDVRFFLSSTQTGFGAIEYVIFRDDSAVVESLSGEDSITCQYVVSLGGVIAEETAQVLAEWTEGTDDRPPYVDLFRGTATVNDHMVDGVASSVRAMTFLVQEIANLKLGLALGAGGGAADPTAINDQGGHNSIAEFRAQLEAAQDAYLGPESSEGRRAGIGSMVAAVSPETDIRVIEAFEKALASLETLREPLRETIQDDPTAALEAHARIDELARILGTEVVGALGVSLGFSDNDGDTGKR